jgi:lipopolysaccharide assembly protein A
MIILFILGLVLGGVAVLFALQNVTVITVAFFHYQLTGSLALILILAILAGVLVTLLLLLPGSIVNYFRYRRLSKEVVKLEEELRKQKALTVFAKNTPPPPQVIEQIEKGAIDSDRV